MFDYCWKFALKWEGGLDDDPDDPGGITHFGVDMRMLQGMEKNPTDRRNLQEIGVQLPICRESVIKLKKAQAKLVYKYEVWDKLGCFRFPLVIACVLFDAGVLNGVNAVKFIQRAWNARHPNATPLAVDGILGPKTRQAILTDADPRHLAKVALDKREYWFRSYVKAKPKAKKYLKGWLNRVNDLRKYLGLK